VSISTSSPKTRFCVFCGKNPEEKNNEHIVPKWLIKLTGEINREITIGPLLSKDEDQVFRKQSFNSFKFPACEACNKRFSHLEAATKPIMIKILNGEGVSDVEFDIFLDWFDKVRIGLWLGFHQYLDGNMYGIAPNYYINQRVGFVDRALVIYRMDTKPEFQSLNFIGANTPAFAYNPSCFALLVNNFIFMNISQNYLIGEKLGIFKFNSLVMLENDQIASCFTKGSEVIQNPIIPLRHKLPCSEIYQPMYNPKYIVGDVKEIFESEYANSFFSNSIQGVGKVLIKNQIRLDDYPNESSNAWYPGELNDIEDAILVSTVNVYSLQAMFIENAIEKSDFEDRSDEIFSQWRECLDLNISLIEGLESKYVISSK
jgi:hypothetical protein